MVINRGAFILIRAHFLTTKQYTMLPIPPAEVKPPYVLQLVENKQSLPAAISELLASEVRYLRSENELLKTRVAELQQWHDSHL